MLVRRLGHVVRPFAERPGNIVGAVEETSRAGPGDRSPSSRGDDSADEQDLSLSGFFDEGDMRDRIAASPSVLELGDGPKAVATEVGVPRVGTADVVVVDAKGEIAIVECKREKNPQVGRSVIGQVFAYAAGFWMLPYKEFEWRLAERGIRLTEPFENDPAWDRPKFRDTVAQNLEDGAFQLAIAVDRIPPELQRTVAFLHSHAQPGVRFKALELHLGEDGIEAKVYDPGEAGPPRVRRSRPRVKLLAAIRERSGDAAADAAEEMLLWAKTKSQLKLRITEDRATIKAPTGRQFKIEHYREVRVSLGSLARRDDWDAERIERYLEELADIGVSMQGDRPRAPLEFFANEAKRADFLALIERPRTTSPG